MTVARTGTRGAAAVGRSVLVVLSFVAVFPIAWMYGVIVPQLASAFAILLLRQHLKAFPTELIDAARVDGQSSSATLWRVVVPCLGPSLAALGILLFVSEWNEYFWPLLVFPLPQR
jgi:ABC-type glycerol-3-phosphate transport system permease component